MILESKENAQDKLLGLYIQRYLHKTPFHQREHQILGMESAAL